MSHSLPPQSNASFEDDLPLHLASLLSETEVSPVDTGGTITFAGSDPLFPSAVRLGSAFALSAMAAAVGAAAIWRMRTGQGQDLSDPTGESTEGVGRKKRREELRRATSSLLRAEATLPLANAAKLGDQIGIKAMSIAGRSRMDGGMSSTTLSARPPFTSAAASRVGRLP